MCYSTDIDINYIIYLIEILIYFIVFFLCFSKVHNSTWNGVQRNR